MTAQTAERVGVSFEETYAGLLQEALAPRGIEVLNAQRHRDGDRNRHTWARCVQLKVLNAQRHRDGDRP